MIKYIEHFAIARHIVSIQIVLALMMTNSAISNGASLSPV